MKYSKIVAAVREYDRQMALLDAKETQLLKRGTETAVKNCEKDQRLAWDTLKAKIDAGTDRGILLGALRDVLDELETAKGYADDHPQAIEVIEAAIAKAEAAVEV
jgi:hypothetical protein